LKENSMRKIKIKRPVEDIIFINYKNELLRNCGLGLLIILLAFVLAVLTIGRHKWLNIKIVN